MHPVNFKLDRIQNGRLSVIIYFNMPDIWIAIPSGPTIKTCGDSGRDAH